MQMFIVALFMIIKIKYSSTGGCITKLCYIYTMEYYSSIKMNNGKIKLKLQIKKNYYTSTLASFFLLFLYEKRLSFNIQEINHIIQFCTMDLWFCYLYYSDFEIIRNGINHLKTNLNGGISRCMAASSNVIIYNLIVYIVLTFDRIT